MKYKLFEQYDEKAKKIKNQSDSYFFGFSTKNDEYFIKSKKDIHRKIFVVESDFFSREYIGQIYEPVFEKENKSGEKIYRLIKVSIEVTRVYVPKWRCPSPSIVDAIRSILDMHDRNKDHKASSICLVLTYWMMYEQQSILDDSCYNRMENCDYWLESFFNRTLFIIQNLSKVVYNLNKDSLINRFKEMKNGNM